MKTFIVFILGILIAAPLLAQVPDSSKSWGGPAVKFDPARDAEKDIKEAVIAARQSGRRILLDVGGEWCIWCHRLDSLFIKNNDLEEYRDKHFVVVKINVSKENMNKEVLSNYPKVAGYPHLFVLDQNGELLCSQNTGELEYPEDYPVKGHDRAKVFAFLRKWGK